MALFPEKRLFALLGALMLVVASGCQSAPKNEMRDPDLKSFTPLEARGSYVLAANIEDPTTVVCALIDIDFSRNPLQFHYAPGFFTANPRGIVHFETLSRLTSYTSPSQLAATLKQRVEDENPIGVLLLLDGEPMTLQSAQPSDAEVGVIKAFSSRLTNEGITFAFLVPERMDIRHE